MPRFAANLSWLFAELPFAERFAAAARAGFEAVEFLFPYEYAPEELARLQRDAKVQTVLFNLPPGEWRNGERGLAAQPGREQDFRFSIELALLHARALGVRQLHVMAGLTEPDVPRSQQRATYVANLRAAAARAAALQIDLLIEPINPIDMPHYYLTRVAQALDILREVGAPNLRLQFDAYHVHRVGEDPIAQLRIALPHVAHVQIAGSPGRHEPDTGDFDYRPFFQQLDTSGYSGWVGCEYAPAAATEDGLSWRESLTGRSAEQPPTPTLGAFGSLSGG
ncbi:hydroxypyruvate isomerase family protein [Niveibacterium umoris]|uniref:Hydroxypyruvate isomerase n=1 Tax=Niveibacterium umoris TaxID=1193620 RepID=A0A840BGB9_9RHOO|nr:2-oxo-tetronate isomerase [Niveibacterium umoris]MBB4010718.1 hydroxypyruvate isomerase [Niveibacterium umoris]